LIELPNLATRLHELRIAKGLTQKQIAAELKISYRIWRAYEEEQRTPTFDGLIALADYFDVSVDYIVGRSDEPKRA
jgi:transcriptional regulator with XRE-family HTH domain